MNTEPTLGSRRLAHGGLFTFALILIVLLLAYAQTVWDETGVVLAGGGLLALIAINGLISFVAMRSPHVEALASLHSISGERAQLPVSITRPHRTAVAVVPTHGEKNETKSVVAVTPATGLVALPFLTRGVHRTMELQVMTTAPFGLIGVARTIEISVEVTVAPATVTEPLPALGELQQMLERSGLDEQLGPRQYVPGDQRRLVHWAATARTGDLMVREFEGDTKTNIAIVLDLGPIGSLEGELAACRARWYCEEAIGNGLGVHLTTLAPGGQIREAVTTPAEVQQRLAAAIPGPSQQPTGGSDPVLSISPQGDGWLT